MIEGVTALFIILHTAGMLFIYLGFRRYQIKTSNSSEKTFSIIIPVRNEAKNISDLLRSIERMDYPKELYEVIVVDDSSSDRTKETVASHDWKFKLSIHSLPENAFGKKSAIELGVKQAKNEIIVTTDGDCTVRSGWLSAYAMAFVPGVKMILGPVRMMGEGLFGQLQCYDFHLLIAYTVSLVKYGIPSTANGANLAYTKEAFEAVGGYNTNRIIPSGDDEFLLLKIVRKFPNSVAFLKSREALVHTRSKKNFSGLLDQRIRWMSKWTAHRKIRITLSVIVVWLDSVLMLGLILGALLGLLNPLFLSVVFIRALLKFLPAFEIHSFYNERINWGIGLIYEIVYPFFVFLLSIASIFGKYTWKDRKY